MNSDWRRDPLLRGRFHPEYPDDLQVIVHDGGPRFSSNAPELMWVRVTGRRGPAYAGTLLNAPVGLKSVRQGQEILFLAVEKCEHPFRTSEKYLKERPDWAILGCSKCGLAELWDAPSDLLAKLFPNIPAGSELESFTSFCPICGGAQVISKPGRK